MATFLTKKHLSRRTFLRGSGVSLALPFLDAMVPAGTALANVVRIVLFHTDIREFYPVIKMWERRLGDRPLPFSAIEVPSPLPVPGATVMIEAWAYVP